jgi:two-component system, OmpR family, phosphate regulon sensor histidine kinase PhoR
MPPIQLLDKAWPAAFAFFLALGAMPTIVFGLLIGFDELHLLPGLFGWAICSMVAVGFGFILGRDVVVMTRLVRALQNHPGDLPRETTLLVPGMRSLGQEALRLIRAERLVRARIIDSTAEDRALVERLPDPLLKLDTAGNLLWRNASAIAAFGTETSAVLRHPALRAALAEAVQAGQPVRSALVLAVPVQRDLDVTVIPVGGLIYVLVTDRTRERSLEKMRADFVANSSHELRTPLASLIGFIETLRGPAADDPEAQKRFLGIMAEQAARMQRVIADLLNLSRIEISEHQPPEELMHLTPLLERVVAGMEPMLKANTTRIEVAIPPDLPVIPADADQLAQVFTNLLDNAIKYGKRGGCIKLVAARAGTDARFESNGVLVSVADDGAGISREHIPRLTERFYRVDKGRSRAVGGTGLGLAIVKHVVNRHRGRLVIDSVEGKGTIFTVWLPARG